MKKEDYLDIIKEDSNRVLENTFMFQNPWDMEQTSVPYTFACLIDWNAQPGEDPEWTFMLSRHGFIANLAKAEFFFQDRRYGDKALSLIEDFITSNPLTDRNKDTSWRSLDAAIRVTNWIDSLEILEKHRNEKLLDSTMEKGIREHIEYLKTFDNTFLRLSNWGAIGNAGLFKASCYLGDEEGIEISRHRFHQSLYNQVLPDGFQWEQSPMYQAEVLLHTLDFIMTSRKYSIPLEQDIEEKARAMAHAFVGMMKPDRRQFMQSDSDSTELMDIIAKSAFVLSDGLLKWASEGMLDPDYGILATKEDVAEYEKLEPLEPSFTNASYHVSGNIYLRSSWSREGSVVHMKTGSHGGGHGHGDLLHIDASLEGEDILIDSGRYTYVDCPSRLELKKASRHNTIIVDGRESFIPKDSWGYERTSRALGLPTIERGSWSFSEGLHLGYMDEGILLSRKVLLLDDILILLDKFEGPGEHSITRPLHLARKGLAAKKDGFYSYGDYRIFSSDSIRSEIRKVSFHYNEIETTDVLLQEAVSDSRNMLYTVIGKGIASVERIPVRIHGKPTLLPSSYIQALNIELEEGDDISILYTVSNDVNGVFLYEAGSIAGATGSLIVQKGARREVLRG